MKMDWIQETFQADKMIAVNTLQDWEELVEATERFGRPYWVQKDLFHIFEGIDRLLNVVPRFLPSPL